MYRRVGADFGKTENIFLAHNDGNMKRGENLFPKLCIESKIVYRRVGADFGKTENIFSAHNDRLK